MSVVISQSELRNATAAVMRRVAAGESFVVTVNGRPVADVVPRRQETNRRRFVAVAELAGVFASHPAPDAAAWQADRATVDEVFGPDEPVDPFERQAR
ncbi:MAG: type II toxin-antitoxin system Phd/YefM family antitoxin [Dermatophilaceae bacterium]